MIDTLTSWLDNQSTDVRTELDNLLGYNPEPEFLLSLVESLPVVPSAGLVDLYYDIFYCCSPVFKMAIRQLHSPEELSGFLVLAERALVNEPDIEAFSSACSEEGDIDDVIFWLKRHASFNRVAKSSA